MTQLTLVGSCISVLCHARVYQFFVMRVRARPACRACALKMLPACHLSTETIQVGERCDTNEGGFILHVT